MSVPNNPFQNPFYNRFNDPVTRRPDEMDVYDWLRTEHDALRQAANGVAAANATAKHNVDDVYSESEANRRHG